MKFLRDNIPCSEDDCKDCETNTVHNLKLKEGTFQEDTIKVLEKFVHTILDSDDQEDIECKKIYNDTLEQNKEMHILHHKVEIINNLDQEKLEEMKQQYDPKSEKILESTWDLSDSSTESFSTESDPEYDNMMTQTLQNFLKMTSHRMKTSKSCLTHQRTTQQ